MKFERVKELDDEKFRRLTSFKRSTFDKMVEILNESLEIGKLIAVEKRNLALKTPYL